MITIPSLIKKRTTHSLTIHRHEKQTSELAQCLPLLPRLPYFGNINLSSPPPASQLPILATYTPRPKNSVENPSSPYDTRSWFAGLVPNGVRAKEMTTIRRNNTSH
mmetsp:Transcript_64345/g.76168  ORF Transcript_64345/g.76168 Transcript_64345/m.76168 type:complete len:106 (-) Transcript_64345:88-405(-)